MHALHAVGLMACLLSTSSFAGSDLFDAWIDGTSENESALQVQQLDTDTYVLRQSLHTSTNAPFLYLLLGTERALLLDTGDGGVRIRPTVDQIIQDRLAARHQQRLPLVVAHLHSHSDHHQGDFEFVERPDTTIVGLAPEDVAVYFGISDWPSEIVPFDLGERVVDVIPAPGHEAAHIVLYDRRTRLLLTGDSLLAGHILFTPEAFKEFRASIDRIGRFMRDKPLRAILGTHVEMARQAGREFDFGAISHPDEHSLELPRGALKELGTALQSMGGTPEREVHDDFIILPVPHELLAPYEYRPERNR
jgi:hydroxyacylglutathione hydrolase